MAKVSLRTYNREIETLIDHGHLDEAIAHCHHILKTFPNISKPIACWARHISNASVTPRRWIFSPRVLVGCAR